MAMAASPDTMLLLSSSLAGLAVARVGWVVLSYARPLGAAVAVEGFEHLRRERLRGNWLYRCSEGLVDERAVAIRTRDEAAKAQTADRKGADARATRLDRIRQALVTSGEKLPWLPEEYCACRRIEGVIIAVFVLLFGWQLFESFITAGIFAGFVGWAYPHVALWSLQGRAVRRRKRVLERLPFALDLMALMMEAGGNFPECLAAAVQENANHPLGEEFGEVLREINLGRTRKEALEGLKERLRGDDVSELVFALVKGDELGTPLAQTLRTQATQMLLKRSQTVEKEAAEAQVMIVFPGMVIMVACLLIIIAPFLLQAVYTP
jgi:tight adherence protein C